MFELSFGTVSEIQNDAVNDVYMELIIVYNIHLRSNLVLRLINSQTLDYCLIHIVVSVPIFPVAIINTVCCGVRGRALVSHTGARGFLP